MIKASLKNHLGENQDVYGSFVAVRIKPGIRLDMPLL
jgi:hypothetical protein